METLEQVARQPIKDEYDQTTDLPQVLHFINNMTGYYH